MLKSLRKFSPGLILAFPLISWFEPQNKFKTAWKKANSSGKKSWKPVKFYMKPLTIEYRYPGQSADKAMAREMVAICRDLRRIIRLSMRLET